MERLSQLSKILVQNGIDSSTLKMLRDADEETVFCITTSGQNALALWKQLRDIVDQTQHWPVLLGNDLDMKYLEQSFKTFSKSPPIQAEGFQMVTPSPASSALTQGRTMNPLEWL